VSKLSDSEGRRCSGAEYDQFALPIIQLNPQVQQKYTDCELVDIGKAVAELFSGRFGELIDQVLHEMLNQRNHK